VGDVRLAVSAGRGVDARDVERALHAALDRGIALVEAGDETAAEELCGRVVRELRLRDRVVLATTISLLAPPPGRAVRDALVEQLPVRYMRERIEQALRATRLEALPLVQLPVAAAWRDSTAWPELAGTCARLVREGHVLAFAAQVDAAFPAGEPFVACAAPWSACQRDPEGWEAPPLLARRPLAGGALAGGIGPGVQLARLDDRREIDPAGLERIAVAMARVALLVHHTPPAARSCDAARAVFETGRRPDLVEAADAADLALRYVIDRGAIALPRLHRVEHVAAAIAAAAAPPLAAFHPEAIFSESPHPEHARGSSPRTPPPG
jgi:aryl-alcohol dehydrogenase-like predicted oxidoreductase